MNQFALPQPGASYPDFQSAADKLNSVELTAEQFERGLAVFIAGVGVPFGGLAALQSFASSEGLEPVDLAAHAILVRAGQVLDAQLDGMDLKAEAPDIYEAIATGPIYAGDLGYYPPVDA